MGQYYKTINLDKKQFLHAHDFGEGLKLLEFGCDGDGLMTGLAILLSDGNGRGGGDIARSTDETKDDFEPTEHERIEGEHTHDGKTHRAIVPKIAGMWKGDRIVIAGDYADDGNFLTADQVKRFIADPANADHIKHWRGSCSMKESDYPINLYVYADSYFENISAQVIDGMKTDVYLREILENRDDAQSNVMRPDMVIQGGKGG